jgi:hypothetical protein
VQAALGDGSVQFYRQTIGLPAWRALSSIRGGETITDNQ